MLSSRAIDNGEVGVQCLVQWRLNKKAKLLMDMCWLGRTQWQLWLQGQGGFLRPLSRSMLDNVKKSDNDTHADIDPSNNCPYLHIWDDKATLLWYDSQSKPIIWRNCVWSRICFILLHHGLRRYVELRCRSADKCCS